MILFNRTVPYSTVPVPNQYIPDEPEDLQGGRWRKNERNRETDEREKDRKRGREK